MPRTLSIVFTFFVFISNFRNLPASPHIEVQCTYHNYIHSGKILPLIKIKELFSKKKFKSFDGKLDLGYTGKNIWIRLECSNLQDTNQNYYFKLDYTLLHLVDFYTLSQIPDFSLGNRVQKQASHLPLKSRYPLAVYNFRPFETKEIYIHVASLGPVIGSLTVQSSRSFFEREFLSYLGLGGYFGLFVANILLVLLLIAHVFLTKNKSDLNLFFTYLFYLLTNTLYQISYTGLGHVYLWGKLGVFSSRSIITLSPVVVLFLNEYGRKFLNLRKHFPILNKGLKIVSLAYLILIPLCYFGDFPLFSKLISQLALVTFVFYFIFSLYLVFKGISNSLLYFLGWSSYLMGTIILILRNFNFLPFNFITMHAQEIGTIVEMTFFSIALVNKIRIRNKELIKGSAVVQTTAAISHELKRPLKVVITELKSLALKHPSLSNELKEMTLPVINSSFFRLNKLLSEYKILGRNAIYHGNFNQIDLFQIMEASLEAIKKSIPQYSYNLNLHGRNTLYWGQEDVFQKIFENLFENAIESGGLNTQIYIKLSNTFWGNLLISIENTESTIPSDIQEDLFKIYTTTKNGGHGIGLSICKKLVEEMGGSISASTSSKNLRTTFKIELPKSKIYEKQYPV